MFRDDDGEWVDDECPQCMVGRIRAESKPFLKLFHKQLFTIPDGVCYICDVCDFYEFDYTNYDIIDKMLDSVNNLRILRTKTTQTLPKLPPEEDLPKQTKFPPA